MLRTLLNLLPLSLIVVILPFLPFVLLFLLFLLLLLFILFTEGNKVALVVAILSLSDGDNSRRTGNDECFRGDLTRFQVRRRTPWTRTVPEMPTVTVHSGAYGRGDLSTLMICERQRERKQPLQSLKT